MKKSLLLLLSITATLLSFAQQDKLKQNIIYLEGGGNGLFASVNYERQLTKEPGFAVRAGVGFYTEKAFYLTLPVGINYLFKLKNNVSFIDAGLGVTWAFEDARLFKKKDIGNDDFVSFIPSVGYRKYAKNGLMWRISLTPVANKYAFTPSVGFSVGKMF